MRNQERRHILMIEEMVNRFQFLELADGRALVLIEVPPEYAEVWLDKLNALYATERDLGSCKSNEDADE